MSDVAVYEAGWTVRCDEHGPLDESPFPDIGEAFSAAVDHAREADGRNVCGVTWSRTYQCGECDQWFDAPDVIPDHWQGGNYLPVHDLPKEVDDAEGH